MDWTAYIDEYCERLAPGLAGEPLNALSNLAFILAAFIMWRRCRGQGLWAANAMVAILAAIGVGSFLFHTFATVWAVVADVVPIAIFSLFYIFVANRTYLRLGNVAALVGALAFLPFAYVVNGLLAPLPFIGISSFYWPLVLMIAGYAVWTWRASPETGRGLALGALILSVSLSFRSLDMIVCTSWPAGTHFVWHALNGLMLGWMIEVYRRHVVEGGKREG